MNKVLSIILLPFKWLFLIPIYIYKGTISKITPDVCVFVPTCSTYAIIAIKRFGVFKGILMGTKRIFRCHSPHCGLDPVPDNLKTNIKYLV